MPPAVDAALYPAEVRRLARDLLDEIADLPRLSLVIEQFLQHTGRDTATAADIGAALERDAVLRDWILRQANSGFCRLNRPIRTVSEACVVLGVEPLTRLVHAACTRDLLTRRLTCYLHAGNGFWLHGLALGAAARDLARLLGDRAPLGAGAAHVAGLLHDAGKLLLDRRLPRSGGPRRITPGQERLAAGHDHGVHAAAVAAVWGLSPDIIAALAGHHHVGAPPAARLLAAAEMLVDHWQVGIAPYAPCEQEAPLAALAELTAGLGADAALLERWAHGLPPLLRGLAEMIRAVGHGRPPAIAGHDDPAPPAGVNPRRRCRARAGRDRRTRPRRDRTRRD